MSKQTTLNDLELTLLNRVTLELREALKQDKSLCHVKELAFETHNNEEVYQIQVIVTRDENDFLEPFQVEEMKNY